jgi:hypothetical protein
LPLYAQIKISRAQRRTLCLLKQRLTVNVFVFGFKDEISDILPLAASIVASRHQIGGDANNKLLNGHTIKMQSVASLSKRVFPGKNPSIIHFAD